MAQAKTVQPGDTITRILSRERGLKEHEVTLWLPKMRQINPHISNLNFIYPQEKVLLPAQWNEVVPDNIIWQNAFDHFPQCLSGNGNGRQVIYLCFGSESIDEIARKIFIDTPYANIRLSSKRALLLHNNPFLCNYLPTNKIPPGASVDISPTRFTRHDHQFWTVQRPHIIDAWDQLSDAAKQAVQDTGTDETYALADLLQKLKAMGGAIGEDDVLRFSSYGVAGVSGYAESGQMALGNVQVLTRELYEEAVAKFGKQVVQSKRQAHLIKLQQFLVGHPKYKIMMQSRQDLPKYLLPKGRLVPNVQSGGPVAAARHFRKAFSLPFDKWNSTRFLSTIGRQLNGKAQLLKGVGRHATWYIPAAIGLYNVAQAPSEFKMRTLFEEGFGILGGALGTKIGMLAGIGVISLIGFGPLGAFVIIFLFASAGGIISMEVSKKFGRGIHDYLIPKVSNKVYYNPQDLIMELR